MPVNTACSTVSGTNVRHGKGLSGNVCALSAGAVLQLLATNHSRSIVHMILGIV